MGSGTRGQGLEISSRRRPSLTPDPRPLLLHHPPIEQLHRPVRVLRVARYVSGSSTFSYTVRSPIKLNAWKMNPMRRFLIRARSAAERFATGRSSSRYVPSVGVSSRPSSESSVVLPHPDGPAIET